MRSDARKRLQLAPGGGGDMRVWVAPDSFGNPTIWMDGRPHGGLLPGVRGDRRGGVPMTTPESLPVDHAELAALTTDTPDVAGVRETLAEVLSWTSGEMTRYSPTAHPDHNRWSWHGDGHGAAMLEQFRAQADAVLAALSPVLAQVREAAERAGKQIMSSSPLPVDHAELAALRKVAEAANGPEHQRPWEWSGVGEHGYPQQVIRQGDAMLVAECYEGPDFPSSIAEHISTFDPPTVLALLDKVEELTAERDEWKRRRDNAVETCRFRHQDGLTAEEWHARFCGAMQGVQRERARAVAAERRVADLEAGITALADEWEQRGSIIPKPGRPHMHAHKYAATALRSLLSQSGKGQTEGQERRCICTHDLDPARLNRNGDCPVHGWPAREAKRIPTEGQEGEA